MRQIIYMMSAVILLSAVMHVNGQDPMIEADENGITFIVQDGQRIGYRIGDKNVTFADDMPTDWRQYTNTNFMYMFSAMQSSAARSGGALGLPGMEQTTFAELELAAAGGTVNFWMYDGSRRYNDWVDNWLAPKLLQKYQITVTRAPNQGAPQAVARVAADIANDATGSVDLIWINGNNFRNLKAAGHAYCGWAYKLPSGRANYNWFSPAIAFDFRVPTSGCAMPYNTAQIVFFYHTVEAPNPPRTIPDLMDWIKRNPGKFAYANALTDFMGSAFVRQVFYHYAGVAQGGSWTDFLGSVTVDEALYSARAARVFVELKSINNSLANPGGIFPASATIVNELYSNGTTYLNLAYDPAHAGSNILSGTYPNETDSYVMDDGTISNTNFVAIPTNAGNKAAALVAADVIGSIEAVFTRAQPENIGALPAYDANSASFQASGWNTAFNYIDAHASVPSVQELVAGRLTEISSDYKDRINKDWDFYVRQEGCGRNPQTGITLIPC